MWDANFAEKFKAMKNLFIPLFFISLLTACTPGTSGQNKNVSETPAQKAQSGAGLKSEIAALEAQLLKSGDATKDLPAAEQLVEKTEAFAKANPKAEETPELLFKAADVANGAKNYGKAVQLWGLVWRDHPNHPRAPMALFLQGFTFDSKLQNSSLAQKYYREFLKQYPNDSLATQVKQLMGVVQKSPEELVKEFEKNKAQN